MVNPSFEAASSGWSGASVETNALHAPVDGQEDRLADVLNHLRTVLRRIESRGAPDELSVEEVQQCDHHQALMQCILAKLVDLDVEIEARLQNYGSSVNK